MRSSVVLASLTGLVLAAPKAVNDVTGDFLEHLSRRATVCGNGDVVRTADYNVRNEFRFPAVSGSQCTTVQGQANDLLFWSTKWSWAGDASKEKSFAAAQVRQVGSVPISSYSSLSTTWKWSYDIAENGVANVAYEIQGGSVCGSFFDWNLQVWLGTYGSLNPPGSPTHTVDIGGVSFTVYQGFSHHNSVRAYTFVADTEQRNYTGDLLDFVEWTIDNLQVRPHWCIYSAKGGTAAYKGTDATFTTDRFVLRQDAVLPPRPTVPPGPPGCIPRYGQCGGIGWSGPDCCEAGTFCAFWNDWESQCLPI